MNPIEAENRREGAPDWQLTRVRLEKNGGFRSPAIEGYCSRQSVAAGESIKWTPWSEWTFANFDGPRIGAVRWEPKEVVFLGRGLWRIQRDEHIRRGDQRAADDEV